MTLTQEIHAATPPATHRRQLPFVPLALCLGLTALVNAAFALKQTLWLDETTQLSGLSLSPVELTRWLAGTPHDFGCPTAPDRMPPLSYWFQWLWAQVLGGSQLSYRFSGVLCVTLAVWVIFAVARRAWGTGPACVAALLAGLSPAVMERAPEIRAYPFYLLASTLAYFCLFRYLDRSSPRWLAALCAALVLTFYTHFLGVIFAGAVFAALLITQGRRLPIFLAAAATALAGVGLYPFVANSREVSKFGYQWPLADRLRTVGETLMHLLGLHLTSYLYVCVPLALLAAFLLAASLLRSRKALTSVQATLFLVLALGLGVDLAASFLVSAFKPALFQYNLWMVPATVLLIASMTRSVPSSARDWARIAAALLLISVTIGAARTALLGERIIHGPNPRLLSDIRTLGPQNVTLIHERGSDPAAVQVFYPVSYTFHGTVPQFTWKDAAFSAWDHPQQTLSPADAATPFVIVARTAFMDMNDIPTPRHTPFDPAAAALQLNSSAHWRLRTTYTTTGMMRTTVWIYERRN